VPKEEAAEAARKLWDFVKTVVTVGGRTAWLELVNPPVALEGTVSDRLDVEAVTPPNEPAFWGFIAAAMVLAVFALTGQWVFPLLATVTTLVLSWLRWRRPYFSPLAWKRLLSLIGKPAQVPSAYLKIQTATGLVQVALIGERQGDLPAVGDRVQVWGIADDKAATQLRAWKLQPLNAAGQPAGKPCLAPRLVPLVPALFFASLGATVLAWLVNLVR
jgi:hypothetical protein